ncbi:3-hydroxy-5-phosphonooxypentane-2,4-dione thiolase [Pseudovibrio sp. Tun.PSC04-5.I4]|uniref:3-hydroxy-5-phosphonooxypentane-2,4-dione thiolase n=1 Tax=Pseudovibrio sp. Tun.PSC04-5.I4 TaxID=1798213 RepID=UPI000881E72B|nr:3-hydroxy-5-phosphonooxypentane-2,4-dione thiolase [Pseudovibrio sp. Tun.PSC04-5.I4]SDR47833.1 putative autoinducer-2 (AI-2) aldolase [Pseudovibrio sp. Tun.PSC04-5.I4]
MADLDDIREGKDFGLDKPLETSGFYLKGCDHLDWGIKDRLSRIFRPDTGRTVMLAFDHGFIMGPTSGLERIDLNIVPIAKYADCLMAARGIIRSSIPPLLQKPICLRSDAGSSILTELNHNVVLDVTDAARLNASALAIMVAIGDSATEAKTVANLYKAVDEGQKFGIPVMGVTAVGKDMARDAKYFSLASRICAENGANVVKTYYCEGFEKVTASCPVPIVIAGGKKLPELEALELAYRAIDQGAAGVDMGRNVFQSEAPAAMIQAVSGVVHDNLKPDQAFDLFQTLKAS